MSTARKYSDPGVDRYVGFDDDPSRGGKRARLAEGLIVNAKNEYSARAQDTILTGSFILPTEESAEEEAAGEGRRFAWQRQYMMHLEKNTDTRGNYVLFVDEEAGMVTYKELAPQKVRTREISNSQEAFLFFPSTNERVTRIRPLL